MNGSSKSSQWRAVVVGCGPIGAIHAEVIHSHPAAELVGVCAPTPTRRESLAAKHGTKAFSSLDEALQQCSPDCVFVASPDEQHIQQTMSALQAGCHVLAEKPLGHSEQEARDVYSLADDKSLQVGVTYNRRYGFGYQQAKRLLSDNTTGTLRQIWLQVTDGTPPPHVATRPDVIFWTLLGHHLDMLRFLGGEIRSVTASLCSSRADQLVDDVNVSCELDSGVRAILSAAYRDDQRRTTERCEIVCSSGGIVVEDVTRRVHYFQDNPDHRVELRPNIFQEGNAFYESLSCLIQDFIDKLVAAEPPSVSAADAVAANRLAEAALASHKSGTTVQL